MKKSIFGGLLCASCVMAGTAFAEGYDDTGAFYISPMANYTLLDDKRIARNEPGYQVSVGYNLPVNLALEIVAEPGDFGITNSFAREKITAWALDALYKFTPPTFAVRPYFVGGGGEITDTIGGNDTPRNQEFMAEAGLGMLAGIGNQTGATRLQFRTEVKYRREFVQHTPYIPNNPGDVLFNMGFQLSFGNPVPPPPPVAKAVEVEPPPPAPPPPPPPPPPLDSDGDGVPDSIDRCPNTPHGDKVDAYGCTIKQEIRLPGVTFATNSADLTPESDTVLTYAVQTLNAHPELVIEVDGHTDSTGSDKYNLVLSQRRAQSVLEYLKSHGVTNTLTAKGYGKAEPIEDNRTAEGRLANRRVALKVLSGL